MSLTPIAQAVVTDPGGGSAGYALVAASPSLAPEDAELLERSPGVSEYLHTERNPRPCFSFFQLPSGAWGLSRRFVKGQRRGDFNRIVAHTLVLADDVLLALAEEPSLLTSHCTYQPYRGPSSGSGTESILEFFQLGKIAAEPTLRELDDLICQPPADLSQALVDLTSQRCKFLLLSFDTTELEERLMAVFGALVEGKNVLLPQGPVYEELVRLAWSSLPPADRRQVPWTTHFAPGVRIAFRMLNAPNPHRAQEQQTHPEQWRLVDQPSPPVDPSVSALAAAVARNQPPLAVRLGDLGRWSQELRLFGGRGAVQRWLAWITHWSRQIEQGCDTLQELQDFYAHVSQASTLDPWIQAGAVLRCTCHSIGTLTSTSAPALASTNPEGLDRTTIDAVHSALTRHGLQETVLDTATLATLARGTFGDLEARAVALALRSQRPPPGGRAEREALFESMVAGLDVDFGPVTDAVLLDLAFELVSCDSPIGRQILTFLASESPGSIGPAASRLAALADPLPAAAMLIDVLRDKGGDWQAILSDVVADILVPWLAEHDEMRGVFDAERLIFVLRSASAEALAKALAMWRQEPYALAVNQLRSWISEAPELARQAVASFAADATAQPTERLAGVSLYLSQLKVPVAHWIPFAIAEAAWFDSGAGAPQLSDKVFMPLASLTLTEGDAASSFEKVLAALSRHASIAGRCHRALFQLMISACRRYPDEIVRTFESFFDAARGNVSAGAKLLDWAPAISEARQELDDHRFGMQASRLVALWWQALADVDKVPPPELLPTLDWVLPVHRQAMVRAWLYRLQNLAGDPAGKALTKKLQALVPGDVGLKQTLRHAELKSEVHPESQELVAKLNDLHQQVGGDPIALQELLDARALPSNEPQRSFAVLELLTSTDKLWPDIYEVLEVDFLVSAVAEVLENQPQWLMSVDKLVAREQVLVRVAKKLGQTAWKNLGQSIEFLHWALVTSWATGRPKREHIAQRDLFVATLLASSEVARETSWDLLEGLVETREVELLERLRQVAVKSEQPYLRSLLDTLKRHKTELPGRSVR